MRKIAVLNQKGGVGKTTTVVNVSAALALKGKRVLVIDLDPQAHLTIHLGADQKPDTNGAYEVLTGSVTLKDAIGPVRDNLWLLEAGIDLVGAEAELVNEVGREIILRQAVESVRDQFDYLIIDCPPSLGLLTLNSLAAVDEVLIPIQPHFLALQGFSRLLQTITLVQTRINPALRVTAILMCMFDSRTSLSNEVREDIQQFLSGARDSNHPWAQASVVPIHIRRNIKLAEAPSHGQTIFEYEPNCHGAADYQAVAAFLNGDAIEVTIENAEVPEEDEENSVEQTDDASMGTETTDEAPQDSQSPLSSDREKVEPAESIPQEQSTQNFGV